MNSIISKINIRNLPIQDCGKITRWRNCSNSCLVSSGLYQSLKLCSVALVFCIKSFLTSFLAEILTTSQTSFLLHNRFEKKIKTVRICIYRFISVDAHKIILFEIHNKSLNKKSNTSSENDNKLVPIILSTLNRCFYNTLL